MARFFSIDWNRFHLASLRFVVKVYRFFKKAICLVMFGGPGAGKGTVSKRLEKVTGAVALSTGDVLRAAIKAGTPIGLKAKEYVESGRLVPDAVAVRVVIEEMQDHPWKYRRGVILDGAIRTLIQAQAFDKALKVLGLSVTKAVLLNPADDVLIDRLSKRLNCSKPSCGRTYHLVTKPPQVPGLCDVCKSPLYQRKDDVPEVIAERLSIYRREVTPICEYYAEKLVVVQPTAEQTEDQVFAVVTNALRA
jgi:adenylate kinase